MIWSGSYYCPYWTNFILIITCFELICNCSSGNSDMPHGAIRWSRGLSVRCLLCLGKYAEISCVQILCRFLALTPFDPLRAAANIVNICDLFAGRLSVYSGHKLQGSSYEGIL